MVQKFGKLTSWGNGSWKPKIYQVLAPSFRWLGMGFLKHQQYPPLRSNQKNPFIFFGHQVHYRAWYSSGISHPSFHSLEPDIPDVSHTTRAAPPAPSLPMSSIFRCKRCKTASLSSKTIQPWKTTRQNWVYTGHISPIPPIKGTIETAIELSCAG